MINTLEDTFNKYMSQYGQTITINDDTENKVQGFFQEYSDGKNSHDHKYIYTDLGQIKQGDTIIALGKRWICIAQPINVNNVYLKVLIREIKFGITLNSVKIPCIMDSINNSVETSSAINVPYNSVDITIQETEENKSIAIKDNLFVANKKLKVEGIDYSKRGLITLFTTSTAFETDETPIWGEYEDVGTPTEPALNRSIRFTVLSSDTPIENATITIQIEVGEDSVLIGYDPMGRPMYENQTVYEEVEYITDSEGFAEIMVEELEALEQIEITEYNYSVVADGYTTIEGSILKADIDNTTGIDVSVEMVAS